MDPGFFFLYATSALVLGWGSTGDGNRGWGFNRGRRAESGSDIVAVLSETRNQLIILWCRIRSPSCSFDISRMFAFVAPAIWGTLVTIPLNGPPATLPQSLILGSILPSTHPPCTPSNAFDKGTLVVVSDGTAPIAILNLNILLMAPHAVELRRRMQIREEIRDSRKRRVR